MGDVIHLPPRAKIDLAEVILDKVAARHAEFMSGRPSPTPFLWEGVVAEELAEALGISTLDARLAIYYCYDTIDEAPHFEHHWQLRYWVLEDMSRWIDMIGTALCRLEYNQD